MYTDNYIVKSLELHLFFGRIMKEHSLFLKAGFTPANTSFSQRCWLTLSLILISKSSPVICPYVSFTFLKWSTSTRANIPLPLSRITAMMLPQCLQTKNFCFIFDSSREKYVQNRSNNAKLFGHTNAKRMWKRWHIK